MEKKVIKQGKTTIVILKDYAYYPGIEVKGIAKCDDRDEYNEELGEKIANAKAWIKYYNKLSKFASERIETIKDTIVYCTERVNKTIETKQYADDKLAKITSELEELIKED